MATDVLPATEVIHSRLPHPTAKNPLKQILEPIASLKLTVVLFALSIFLILAGTFAQVDKDIWEVIGLYFRIWFAWVPFQVFFPPSFFPEKPVVVSGGIWFPGGKLLGLLLAMNLVSAHAIRFKAAATGNRLLMGWAGIAVGCVFTWAIIAAGGNSRGIQGEPWMPYSTQWIGYRGLVGLGAMLAAYGFVVLCRQPLSKATDKWIRQLFLRGLLVATSIGLASLLGWILSRGEAVRPTDASLRILWQLTQGTVASMALFGGCWAVFGKRAGIVLLHGGIGLMMFYELHVALTAVETQMQIGEGERTNYVQDIRTFELAVINTTDPKEDKVVAIPKSILLSHSSIESADLPFKLTLSEFQENCDLRAATPQDKNPATDGLGRKWIPEARKPGSGTDSDSRIDYPAAYVTLESKSDGTKLGTYLVSQLLAMNGKNDSFQVGDQTYQLELRPKRYYKPYQFELKDVRKEDYIGTSTPRNYASTVHIIDPTRNVDEEKTIWMNNPLRFADETFYQSNYHREKGTGYESTVLSVVANSGWMMPYVGCMLVSVGMLFHFLSMLIQFLTRGDFVELSDEQSTRAAALADKLGIKPMSHAETVRNIAAKELAAAGKSSNTGAYAFAIAMVLISAMSIGRAAMPPKPQQYGFDFYRFGQIPVVSDGRAKPLDSAASAALLAISGRTTVKIEDENAKPSFFRAMAERIFGGSTKIPATQWLAEVIADTKVSNEREVFRIENLELQETIGVKKREGMRYTSNEIRQNFKELAKQLKSALEQSESGKPLSVFQKKTLEFGDKLQAFSNLQSAFGLHNQLGGKNNEEVLRAFQDAMLETQDLEERRHPVFAIGPKDENDKWHTLSRAWLLDLVDRIQNKTEQNKAVAVWDKILKSFADDKPTEFNKAVDEMLLLVDEKPPRDVKPWVIRLEAYLNHTKPFTNACVLYVIAFILGALGWLGWPKGFNRAAFGVLLVSFAVHSFALWARLIISGRPPVTNLYSSAIFIGWGCVLLGLLFEIVYGIGIGNLVAAVAGYATLLVADALAADGDTFTVLQAVLDTQFWLATHVTCITLGYATTYLAGLFGVAYIIRGVCTPSLTEKEGKEIYRMIYGMLCFSTFFSFVGTVLGGLWADDSWGRFWGWDPKENAALIVVLWNALALHARWGGLVKERGLAALAVCGNIFVSWSWWGVNALGTGLHSYGFKQGTLQNLGIFIVVNLLIVGVALLPKSYWWSLRRRANASE